MKKSLLQQSAHHLSQSRPVLTTPTEKQPRGEPAGVTPPRAAANKDLCEHVAPATRSPSSVKPVISRHDLPLAAPSATLAVGATGPAVRAPAAVRDDGALAALRAELDRAKAQNRTLASERDAAQASRDALRDVRRENTALTRDVQQLRVALDAANDSQLVQERRVEKLRGKNASLTRDVQDLDAALRDERCKPPVYIEPNAAERAQWARELEQLEDRKEQLLDAVEQLRSDESSVATSLAAGRVSLQQTQEQLAGATASLRGVEAGLRAAQTEQRELSAAIAAERRQQRTLRADLTQLGTDLASARTERDGLQGEQRRLQQLLDGPGMRGMHALHAATEVREQEAAGSLRSAQAARREAANERCQATRERDNAAQSLRDAQAALRAAEQHMAQAAQLEAGARQLKADAMSHESEAAEHEQAAQKAQRTAQAQLQDYRALRGSLAGWLMWPVEALHSLWRAMTRRTVSQG